MKNMLRFAVASAAFFYVGTASAQWQVPDHSVPVGRGAGTGFKFASPGTAGQALVSNGASSDPSFQAIAGGAFGSQTANTIFAGPASGGGANPTFRTLVGSDLPNPSASTLGGVQSKAAVTNQWINSISTSGVPSSVQPAFTDISGTAAASQGGTGLSTFAVGDLIQANTTSSLARLAAVATGNVLLSGGVGVISSWGKVGLTTHVSGTLPIANGGTNCTSIACVTAALNTFTTTLNGMVPAPGAVASKFLRDDGTWQAVAGAGTVTSVTCGTGLSGGTITASGTCAVSLSSLTNSLGADVALSNTGLYFDGPSVAQGTTGTWYASGTVSLVDTAGAAQMWCKLWDGTTTISSTYFTITTVSFPISLSLSGMIASPAGNIRISCRDISSTSGAIKFNGTGTSKDSTITAFRIQ